MLNLVASFQRSMKNLIIYSALQMREEHLRISNIPINLSKVPIHLERLQFVRIKMHLCATHHKCLSRAILNIYKRNNQKRYESHRALSSYKLIPHFQALKAQCSWTKVSLRFQLRHLQWDQRTRNYFSSSILMRHWSTLLLHQESTLRVCKRGKNTLMS